MRSIILALSLLTVFGSAGFAQTGSKGSTTSGQSAGFFAACARRSSAAARWRRAK
ncbi:hypothetical protein ACVWZL_003150 [Bradyrhizobium sp. GM2.4]